MSTALALIPTTAVVERYPGSAIAQVFQATPVDIVQFDEAAFCDEEENEDLHGIDVPVRRVQWNAKEGRFHEAGEKDLSVISKAPSELTGIMLARVESSVHFHPKDDAAKLAARLGYGPLLEVEKTICRNDNLAHLDQAVLANGLTEAQVAAARSIGIGGATGKGCAGCVAAKYYAHNDRNVRLCTRTENIVWLDSVIKEPFVLQVNAQASAFAFRQFLSKNFRMGKKKRWLCSAIVKLSWVGQEMKGNQIKVLKPEIVGILNREQIIALLESRDLNINMLERATRQMEEQGFIPEDASETAVASNGAPPPSDADYSGAVDIPF